MGFSICFVSYFDEFYSDIDWNLQSFESLTSDGESFKGSPTTWLASHMELAVGGRLPLLYFTELHECPHGMIANVPRNSEP